MKNHPAINSSEEKILFLIKGGLTNNNIAKVLGKSEDTIKYHLKRIYRKLGVNNRIEAINEFNNLIKNNRL
ncbi:MAG TPA: helix-turn-helix transcriptional regulator [Bacteroidales bacterium]|nr:helix-turn-helix transcriptional regulator [Bacteroidales bacterium]